jgi:hypothetical protein
VHAWEVIRIDRKCTGEKRLGESMTLIAGALPIISLEGSQRRAMEIDGVL